ncbi:hypothetical protein ACFLSQ_11495 [Bacteroidota bacterium]
MGYMINHHDRPYVTPNPIVPEFKELDLDVVSNNFYAGLIYEYHLGNIDELYSSIIARIVYEDKSANFEQGIAEDVELVADPDYQSWKILRTHYIYNAKWQLSYITFNIFYKQNFSKSFPLGIVVGPSFSLTIEKSSYETISLESDIPDKRIPDTLGVKLINNGKTAVVHDGDIYDGTAFQVGIHIHLQYEIVPKEGIMIIPEIGYTYDLMNVMSVHDWRIVSIYAGVSARFTL